MDNNSNNNISNIPNVGGIKFDDTPAESFDNLYGGVSGQSQPISDLNMNQAPGITLNSAMNLNNNQTPDMIPNPDMVSSINSGVLTQSNPSSVEQSVTDQSTGVVSSINSNVLTQPNVSNMAQSVADQSIGAVSNINSNIVADSNVEDLSTMDIDADKMQSIEEQLSKTSQYNPADFQQEQIVISNDDQSDKSNSGLAFVIILFIVLAIVVAFLPQISKLFK